MSVKDMTPRQKKILRRAFLIFLGLLLGINAYHFNARNIVGNHIPMLLGIGGAVVQSGSMEPVYSKGDFLLVKSQSDYRVGDVVVYQSGSILIVHRLISINGSIAITKGDANDIPDMPFDISCIKGRVVFYIPAVGYIIDFFKTLPGILLLLGTAILLVELSFRSERRAEKSDVKRLQSEIKKLRHELKDKDNQG